MLEKLIQLNQILLDEMPEYKNQAGQFSHNYNDQRQLLRSLMNVRSPMPLKADFLKMQNEFLQKERTEKGVTKVSELTPIATHKQIYLWQGDITTLNADAIVNAANSALLGCFVPCHACIDNAIHSASGLQLRNECNEIMQKQGQAEITGGAKITNAYNLPCKKIIHTVGPIIHGKLTEEDCKLLKSSYIACLTLAIKEDLQSIAFCCISTGEFHFPNDKAAEIAIQSVYELLEQTKSEIKVIFNVFKDTDYKIYRELLGPDC